MEPESNHTFDFSKALSRPGPTGHHTDHRGDVKYEAETSALIQWVIRHSGGLIQDERQASYVLLGFAALAVIVSLALIFGAMRSPAIFTPQHFTPVARPGS